jgi:hypothetical protein
MAKPDLVFVTHDNGAKVEALATELAAKQVDAILKTEG